MSTLDFCGKLACTLFIAPIFPLMGWAMLHGSKYEWIGEGLGAIGVLMIFLSIILMLVCVWLD